MALKPCRECGETVSTEAKACPKCGVVQPTKPSGPGAGQKIKGAGALLLLLGVAWCMVPGSPANSDKQTPLLDHKLPWFTRANALLCATKEDLANFRENASLEQTGSRRERKLALCWAARDGEPVVEVDHDGSFDPDYLVRLATGKLAWTPSYALRN